MKTKISKYLIIALSAGLILTMTACTQAETNNNRNENSGINSESRNETGIENGAGNGNGTENKEAIVTHIQSGTLTEEQSQLTVEGYGSKGALADNSLSVADMLMYAVQDEFAAKGEYEAIIEKFGSQNPYANIIQSEQSHIEALFEVYTAYGLGFPEDNSEAYIVVPSSLKEAAETGVQAEIDNIAMYDKFLSMDIPTEIKAVFEQLKNGSESHLDAFQKQVDKLS